MQPNVLPPTDPIFCSVCGSRLPTVRSEDEGLHCTGTIRRGPRVAVALARLTSFTLGETSAKSLFARWVAAEPCKAVYWPQAATAVVVVIQPVIRDDDSIGVLEVQRMGRGGVVRPSNKGWCFPSGFTKFGKRQKGEDDEDRDGEKDKPGNTIETDGEREVFEESGAMIVLTNLVGTDEDGDQVVRYTNSVILDAETATEGHAMILILARPIRQRDLERTPFIPNRETSARRIGDPSSSPLVFSIHRRWKKLFFSGHYAAQSTLLSGFDAS